MSDPSASTAPTPRPTLPRRVLRWVLVALVVLLAAVVVLNWTWGRLPAEPTPTGSLVTVGGLRIHYLERVGNGLAVVLLHGLPGTADDFDAMTTLLVGHRTIAIDRPGFGYSTGGYVPFARQLEVIHELLARLGIARAIFVGHSYGGTVALGYAERYPAQVAGLVLVDAAAAGQQPSGTATFQAHLVQVLQLPVVRQLADVTFSQLFRKLSAESGDREAFSPDPVASAHLRRLLAINMTSGNLDAFAGEQLAAKGVIEGVDRRLAMVRTYAVVIQGESDRLVNPSYGRRLAATLPDARLVLLAGGHMQTYEHPRAVADAVEAVARATMPRAAARVRTVRRTPRRTPQREGRT